MGKFLNLIQTTKASLLSKQAELAEQEAAKRAAEQAAGEKSEVFLAHTVVPLLEEASSDLKSEGFRAEVKSESLPGKGVIARLYVYEGASGLMELSFTAHWRLDLRTGEPKPTLARLFNDDEIDEDVEMTETAVSATIHQFLGATVRRLCE